METKLNREDPFNDESPLIYQPRQKTPIEISQEFLEEYRKLVEKYGRDFNWTPQIVEVKLNPDETSTPHK